MAETTPATPAPPPPAAPEAPAAPSGGPSPTPQGVDGAKAQLEAAGGDVPEQKRGETDKNYELRLSKLTRENRLAREEAVRLKSQLEPKDKELALLRAELEKAKTKRLTRKEYVELTKTLSRDPGKVRELLDDDTQELSPAVRERLERLEARLKEADERDQGQRNSEVRTRDIGVVSKYIESAADELPMFAGEPKLQEQVYEVWRDRWETAGRPPPGNPTRPDLGEVAAELHGTLATTIVEALQSDRTRSFLLKLKPELKALLGHQVGASGSKSDAQGAATGNGSSASPSSAHSSKPLTGEAARLARIAVLEEARKAWQSG